MLLPVYIYPHYAAPITSAIYALMMLALQRLRHWHLGERPIGLFLIRSTLAAVVVMLAIRIAVPVFHFSLVNSNRPETWCSPWYQFIPREEIEKQLEAIPGDQLVLVHFGPAHEANKDWPWISNSSDIDHSKIVWAYDMAPKQNEELMHYFSKRQVWIAYPDDDPIGFSPYRAKVPF